MYYIVSNEYAGQVQQQRDDTIEIRTCPANIIGSDEECVDGYCGATNDWMICAHGEFKTIESARAEIEKLFGDVHKSDKSEAWDGGYDDDVVEVYKRGRYPAMDSDGTYDWTREDILSDIAADTTDERIDELIEKYEREANDAGYTLDTDSLQRYMQDRRQELLDELENEG